MAEKTLDIFEKCTAECVHLCPPEEEHIFFSWGDSKMCTPSTIANSQRIPNKRNKSGDFAKVRVLVEQVIL